MGSLVVPRPLVLAVPFVRCCDDIPLVILADETRPNADVGVDAVGPEREESGLVPLLSPDPLALVPVETESDEAVAAAAILFCLVRCCVRW